MPSQRIGFAAKLAIFCCAITATMPAVAQQLQSDNLAIPLSVPQQGPISADAVTYDTLDAAVAAQAVPDTLDEDVSCMAGAVYFEAKGEPLSGQLAVAHVILNRSRSGRFPASVCSVVTQPGQFSFVRGGRIPEVAACRQWRTAVAVARVALAAAWGSPVSNAMYFHARRASPNWHRVQVAAIGNHVFYR